MAWQEQWCQTNQHGYRCRHGCEDVWWALALKVEHALLTDETLVGVSLDYAKCFDRVPVDAGAVKERYEHVMNGNPPIFQEQLMTSAKEWAFFSFIGKMR